MKEAEEAAQNLLSLKIGSPTQYGNEDRCIAPGFTAPAKSVSTPTTNY
jgi:hypothetical protein